MKSFFALCALVCALALPARAQSFDVQTTPDVFVSCGGDNFTSFDIEPFAGDCSDLVAVVLVVKPVSTIEYRGKNLSSSPAIFDAHGGWLPVFKHGVATPGFAVGMFSYPWFGGVELAPQESVALEFPMNWPEAALFDTSSSFAPWCDANGANGLHRVYLQSWAWASFSPGDWHSAKRVFARYRMHVEYTSLHVSP